MLEALETSSKFTLSQRILLLGDAIKKDSREIKGITVEDLEPYWAALTPWAQYGIQSHIFQAVAQGRLTFEHTTPLVMKTIQESHITTFFNVMELVILSEKYPDLEAPIAEALILNRHSIIDRPSTREVHMKRAWGKWLPESVQWQRCTLAVLVSHKPNEDEHLMEFGQSQWPSAWEEMQLKYELYKELLGQTYHTQSKMIDAIVHNSKKGTM